MTSATIKREIEAVANRIERLICSFQPGPQIRDECVAALRSIASRIDDNPWRRLEDELPVVATDGTTTQIWLCDARIGEITDAYHEPHYTSSSYTDGGWTHWKYRLPPEPPT